MRPGYFFELMPDSDLRSNQTVFRYRRFSIGGVYPVYLVLGKDKIEVCINIPGQYGNTTMFELIYSNYQNAGGKLARQLAEIPSRPKFSISLDSISTSPHLDVRESEFEETQSKRTRVSYALGIIDKVTWLGKKVFEVKNEHTQIQGGGDELNHTDNILYISTQHIFLDFLFDLKHSDEFENSRHYDQLLRISRENAKMDAIIKICEYHYWQKAYSTLPAIEVDTLLRDWQLEKKKSGEKNLVNLLISKSASLFLGDSKWINDNLEKVVHEAIVNYSESVYFQAERNKHKGKLNANKSNLVAKSGRSKKTKDPDKIFWINIAEWSTRRYNYFQTLKAILPLHWLHVFIIVVPLCIVSLGILYALFFSHVFTPEARLPFYRASLVLGGFISILVIFSIWKNISNRHNRIKRPATGAMLIFSSPKILLISFLGWAGVNITEFSSRYFNSVEFAKEYVWLAGLIFLIPMVYLYREIQSEAPDLSAMKVFGRVFSVSLIMLFILFLTGLTTISFIEAIKFSSPYVAHSKIVGNDLFLQIIWMTPFMYFAIIFIQTLFAGKRFTGM